MTFIIPMTILFSPALVDLLLSSQKFSCLFLKITYFDSMYMSILAACMYVQHTAVLGAYRDQKMALDAL